MENRQSGFTLIELILVIVILGILAVVALPRFIDLQDEAEQAALDGVAGALSSGTAINYAASLTDANAHTLVENCAQATKTLQSALPGEYSVGPESTELAPGGSDDCTVEVNGFSATFTAIGATGTE